MQPGIKSNIILLSTTSFVTATKGHCFSTYPVAVRSRPVFPYFWIVFIYCW
jgi:hypothetical protein